MSTLVSGILKDPQGHPVKQAHINFTALTTTASVTRGMQIATQTDNNGFYQITLNPARYLTTITVSGRSQNELPIEIVTGETARDLNWLLMRELAEMDIPRELIKGFREIQNSVHEDINRLLNQNITITQQLNKIKSSVDDAKSSSLGAFESAERAKKIADTFSQAKITDEIKEMLESVKASEEAANNAKDNAIAANLSIDSVERNVKIIENNVLPRIEAADLKSAETTRVVSEAAEKASDISIAMAASADQAKASATSAAASADQAKLAAEEAKKAAAERPTIIPSLPAATSGNLITQEEFDKAIEEHYKWTQSRDSSTITGKRADFSGKTLKNINIKNKIISTNPSVRYQISNAVFDSVLFIGCTFSSEFNNCNFANCDFRKCTFTAHADNYHSAFKNCNMAMSQLWQDNVFTDPLYLNFCNMEGSRIEIITNEGDLERFNLQQLNISNIINYCNLTRARFKITGRGINKKSVLNFKFNTLDLINSKGTYFKGTYFKGTILADFSKGYLFNTKFYGEITGSIFRNAYMEDAVLVASSANTCDFRGATLENVLFSSKKRDTTPALIDITEPREVDGFKGLMDYRYCDFREASLKGAYFRYADLTFANFNSADLTGVLFDTCDIIGADFRNVIAARTGTEMLIQGDGFYKFIKRIAAATDTVDTGDFLTMEIFPKVQQWVTIESPKTYLLYIGSFINLKADVKFCIFNNCYISTAFPTEKESTLTVSFCDISFCTAVTKIKLYKCFAKQGTVKLNVNVKYQIETIDGFDIITTLT